MIFNCILMVKIFSCQANYLADTVKIWSRRIILLQRIVFPLPSKRWNVLLPFHLISTHCQRPLPTRSLLFLNLFIGWLDLSGEFHYDQFITWVPRELLWIDGCTTNPDICECSKLDKICANSCDLIFGLVGQSFRIVTLDKPNDSKDEGIIYNSIFFTLWLYLLLY